MQERLVARHTKQAFPLTARCFQTAARVAQPPARSTQRTQKKTVARMQTAPCHFNPGRPHVQPQRRRRHSRPNVFLGRDNAFYETYQAQGHPRPTSPRHNARAVAAWPALYRTGCSTFPAALCCTRRRNYGRATEVQDLRNK